MLRKLDGYRQGEGASDRQWLDVLGILRIAGDGLDRADLRSTAREAGLADLLEQALAEAAVTG